MTKIDLSRINSEADFGLLRELLLEYSKSLSISLCFQHFDEELTCVRAIYGLPRGASVLARSKGDLAGCVCLREIDQTVCEMKRLYVRPAFRGRGIGRHLSESILGEARILGYKLMRLDTLTSMTEAIALYQGLGFRRTEKYNDNPNTDTLYMERALDR